MSFTDDHFEKLKNRYIGNLKFARNKFHKDARNADTSAQVFGLGFILTSEREMDEFSKRVSENFNWQYEIGSRIGEMLNGLVVETRTGFLNELAQWPQERTVAVKKKTLCKIKLPFLIHYETYDYKGELKERFKLKANWCKENLR